MKTHLFIPLCLITGLVFAQPGNYSSGATGSSIQPPTIVLTGFSANNPNTRAAWSANEDNTYSAVYRDESTNMGKVIIYDNAGNLVAVENELHNGAYPTAIATYYIKNYPKEKFTIWSHYNTDDQKTYFANREQETVWFDRDGNYTQTVKKKSMLVSRKS